MVLAEGESGKDNGCDTSDLVMGSGYCTAVLGYAASIFQGEAGGKGFTCPDKGS
jgi:hypothetical protein